MRGIDVSHWQGQIDWKKVKASGYEFAIIKCSQGTRFVDSMYRKNIEGARNAGLLVGHYHFAEAGDAIKEAEWFLKNADIKKGELAVLDYETYALKDPAKWCRLWLDRIFIDQSFRPLLYTYHGLLKKYDWKHVSDGNFGLWAARYGMQQQNPNKLFRPATGSWAFYAIWQYCSRGKVPGIVGNVDLNTTEMSVETLKKYGKTV